MNDTGLTALVRDDTGYRLVNTIINISNGEEIGRYINGASIDRLYHNGISSIYAFQPLNSWYSLEQDSGKLTIALKQVIPSKLSTLSTSFLSGDLAFFNGYSVYFDQRDLENELRRENSSITPYFYVFKKNETEPIRINSNGLNSKYNHWPRYQSVVMPPMTYVKYFEENIVFPISNLGLIFYFNTKTLEKRTESFPDFEGVNSWSLFYDYIENTPYYVAYMGDNQYNIYHRTDGAYSKVLTMEGFFDSIAAGYALQEKREGDFYVYSKIKLNK
ncbi:hypothetical protein [Roseivirga pacifica]|uniref:hypothetical protein n=1 Tax=Roseivirga pacifica TaxID=1267423 RepID=UPI003BB0887F